MSMPKGKYIFGTVKVGERGQIVIPKEAREIFNIHAGDTLLVLGDEEQGIAVVKADVMQELAVKILKGLGRLTDGLEEETMGATPLKKQRKRGDADDERTNIPCFAGFAGVGSADSLSAGSQLQGL